MNSKKNVFTIKTKADELVEYNDDMKSNTTKNNCRLQIQKQIDDNDNDDMNENEFHIGNILTENKLIEKFYNMTKCGYKFEEYQIKKMKKWLDYTLEHGWFDRFEYNEFQCAVTLDGSGKWRIFVKYNSPEQRNIFWSHNCNCDQCGYAYDNSSRCHVVNFPLGLWDYGDKLGLDDFVGLSTLSGMSWQYDYFKVKKRGKRILNKRRNLISNSGWSGDFRSHELVNIDYMKIICKKLVDCFSIQLNSRGIVLK
jgi:predicted Zn-ribbon and HTH transcriptional regulator